MENGMAFWMTGMRRSALLGRWTAADVTARSLFLSLKASAPREDFLKGVAWEDGLRENTPGVPWRMDGELGKKVRKAKVNLNSDPEALLE